MFFFLFEKSWLHFYAFIKGQILILFHTNVEHDNIVNKFVSQYYIPRSKNAVAVKEKFCYCSGPPHL